MKLLSKKEFVTKITEIREINEKEKYSWNSNKHTKALRW